MTKTPLMSCSRNALSLALGGTGRAKAVWACLRDGENPFRAELGKHLTQALNAHFLPLQEKVVSQHQSRCGTVKLSIGLKDGLEVETVLIPMNGRTTVCVSSQVGCARGCTFCSTGQMKLLHNVGGPRNIVPSLCGQTRHRRFRWIARFQKHCVHGHGGTTQQLQEVERAIHQMTDPLTFGIGAKRLRCRRWALHPI